ncbi:MAG: GAF domain-containing protein [Deltaproteobacteria bacterium]|nr:GAF domain-containing protein [Deltaproteobacteria bacterium]
MEERVPPEETEQDFGRFKVELRRARERCNRLETLAKLSGILNSSLEFEYVKRRATEAAAELLNCETSSLLLKDEEGQLYFEVALGEKGKIVKRFQLKMGEGIAGWVAMYGKPLIVPEAREDPRFFKEVDEAADFVTHNLICVPLRTKKEIAGVIQGINKREGEFTQDDLELFQSLADQIAIALDNARLYEELDEMSLQLVKALSEAIEKRDSYTGGHTQRVLKVCMAMSEYLQLRPEGKRQLMLAAILHDIGKVGIRDQILNKDEELTAEEFDIVKEHPHLGAEILGHIRQLRPIIPGIKYHHEYYDGSGYPEGLKGEEIPFIARIIAVADTFDAMITDRSYQKGMSKEKAGEEIKRNAGTQFDPQVVEAFVKALEKGDF